MSSLDFFVFKLANKSDYKASWLAHKKRKIIVNAGTSYETILNKFVNLTGITFESATVFERQGLSIGEVSLDEIPAMGAELAVYFSKGSKSVRDQPRNLASEGEAQMQGIKMGVVDEDDGLKTPRDYGFDVPPPTDDAAPALDTPSLLSIIKFYDPNSSVNGAIEEFLGLSKNEGNVGGQFMTGHVDYQFMEQSLRAGTAVGMINGGGGTATVFRNMNSDKFAVLTIKHVLPDSPTAASVTVFMDYISVTDARLLPTQIKLRPDLMFFTCPDLDYSFVAVDPKFAKELELRHVMSFDDISPGVEDGV